jgi:hypothetical protein
MTAIESIPHTDMRLLSSVSLVVPAALAVLASVAPSVQAQTVFTSEAAFTAATTSTTLVTFDGFPFGSAPLTSGGVTLSDPENGANLVSVDSNFFGSGNVMAAATTLSLPPLLTISLSAPVTALGINVIDLGTISPTTLGFTLSNGNTGTFFSNFLGAPLGVLFAGVTTTTPFSSITFSNSAIGDAVGFDNLRFGTNAAAVNPVPEPSEWLAMGMAGTSLMGLMIRARSRRRRHACVS